jgi:hypothetical protein
MARYLPKPVVNQFALYSRSVHGRQLAQGNSASAQCVDCHGVHDTRAVSDPLSPVNSKNVANTCARCHSETAKVFKGSPHDGLDDTSCVACHGSHGIQDATAALLTNADLGCANCHEPATADGKVAAEIAGLLSALEQAGPGSKDALARARLAAHTCNVAAVKRAIESPSAKSAADAPTSSPAAAGAENDCLHCHGPFDKLIAASTNYVAPSGEKTSPHRYVPHSSTNAADVPECSHCHSTHSISPRPARGSIDKSKLDVQWCYETCHHEKDFTPCIKCHP